MYDLIVIGSGPGGYPAALRAALRGKKVCVIEKKKIGGECLNWGCIPTKAYLEASETVKKIKSASKFGIKVNIEAIDFTKIFKFKNKIVKGLVGGIEKHFKLKNIDTVFEEVIKVEKNTVYLKNKEKINGEFIIIATGSRPKEFEEFPFKNNVFSNRSIFDLEELPSNIVILGGGVMGVEFATFFSQIGVSVTVIEFMDRVLANYSNWISEEVAKTLKRNKVKFLYNDTVKSVEDILDNKIRIETKNGHSIETEKLLITVGRQRNTEFLSENFKLDSNGKIIVDNNFKTNIENVFAIGDAASDIMLAHNATFQGIHVIDIITKGKSEINFSNIPSVVFVSPPVATVGKISDQMEISESSFLQTGISSIKGASTGKVKLYSENGIVKGAEIYGKGSAEMIMQLTLAINNGMPMGNLTKSIYPHPTLTENILEASEDYFKESIHKLY